MPLVATDYPLLNVFWTVLYIFFFVVWIWVLISVLIDIFRSHDLSGWAKALWLLFVVFLPLIGVLAYVIARGDKMHEHAVRDAKTSDAAMTAYIRDAAGATSTADELTKLAGLRDQGVLTEEQFEAQKAKLLA
jgi:hypothetical protein